MCQITMADDCGDSRDRISVVGFVEANTFRGIANEREFQVCKLSSSLEAPCVLTEAAQ
jgi:hypothetical protein